MTDHWGRVRAELDVWAERKRVAAFWWRDDDAQDASDRLKAMLAVARQFDVTIGLSVIPLKLKPRLPAMLARAREAQVLVHGFAHENHAPPGQAKREFGGSRSLPQIEDDLTRGRKLLTEAFGGRVLPVLVPPWNRIAQRALPLLPGLGFRGLSTWKPRFKTQPVRGLVQVNTHLDVIDWRRGRVIKDERLIAGLLLRKLRWRRERRARASEPLGLLTHHAYWGPEMERIVANLLAATRAHPAAHWQSPASAFGL
jgi:peptidoglycan/xylan/chitin deacetylase (PgdA/CDA1 family)